MNDKLNEIEQYYSSYLETETKEEFEKAVSELFNDLGSLEAYNLLI